MSAETGSTHGHEEHPAPKRWSKEQRQLAWKIAGTLFVGFLFAGVIGPIVLTVIIGLLQGYHA